MNQKTNYMDRALEAEPDTADEQEPAGGPKDEQQRFQSFFNAAIYEENDEYI